MDDVALTDAKTGPPEWSSTNHNNNNNGNVDAATMSLKELEDDDDEEEGPNRHHHSLPESAEDIRVNIGLANYSPRHHYMKRHATKRNLLLLVCGSVLFVLIVSIVASMSKSSSDNNNATIDDTTERMIATLSFLNQVNNNNNSTTTTTTTTDSSNLGGPQHQAANWIANQDSLLYTIPTSLDSDEATLFLQRYALAVLYFATKGEGWIMNLNFLSNQSECDWSRVMDITTTTTTTNNNNDTQFTLGVTCSIKNHVLGLRLPSNNLVGSLPTELGLLSHLHHLSLFSNSIQGTLPQSMTKMTNLNFVSLGSNDIAGTIPMWFGEFTKLQSLELSDNKLTGFLPESLVKMSSLEDLALDTNLLAGEVDVLEDMPSLRRAYLAENLFTGRLGHLFADAQLLELDVSDNNFAGTIPQHFFESKLKVLDLSRNKLTGSLPLFPDENDIMEYLAINDNQLSGTINEDIWNLAGLRHLDISNNQFGGYMPGYALAWMYNLTYLFMANNPFDQGPISKFYDMVHLREISLKNTNRTGTIPDWIGHNLTNLVLLDVGGNELNGTIPSNLGTLTNLTFLLLNSNNLNGSVPESFGTLNNLAMLLLHDNNLTGSVNPICQGDKTNLKLVTSQCGGPNPPVDCSCCTTCCQAGQVDCIKGDLLATFDLSYENYYERDEYVFSEDLVFSISGSG